jgi:hypothetical protein
MAVIETAVTIDWWAKAGGVAVVVFTGIRYVLQIGALIQRLETLTAEVERLRSDLADARLEVADLKARLG